MDYIDVFHGDADGICAMRQLRLAEPRPGARLESGVKRDIGLVARLQGVQGAGVTVVDVSFDVNRDALLDLLQGGCQVFYVDHHYSGPVPEHPALTTCIEYSAGTCSSLLANQFVSDAVAAGWAVMGAYGDNLVEQAETLAREAGLDEETVALLRRAGVALTYNSYGMEVADLHIHPQEIMARALEYEDAVDFVRATAITADLEAARAADMERALAHSPLLEQDCCRIFALPGEAWARRVSGSFAHYLARQRPQAAHAVMVPSPDGALRISVRAPLNRPRGCDEFCRTWPTGGGRAAAGGIDALAPEDRQAFVNAFQRFFHPGSV